MHGRFQRENISRAGSENGLNSEAHRLYREAEEKYASSDYEGAKVLYKLARLEDKAKSARGTPLVNRVILQIAKQENVLLLDSEELLEAHSPHGIVGSEFFFDVYHPNQQGCRIIAQGLAELIIQNRLIEEDSPD